jgi:hypothetical protein
VIDNTTGRDARDHYLRSVLRLKRDPFGQQATAVLEIQEQPEDPPFFRGFVDLESDDIGQSYLDLLLREHDSIVSGPEGSGKTTLCLNLAYQLRFQTPPTLAVTYKVGPQPLPPRRALPPRFTEALATDLLIHVAEQHGRLSRAGILEPLTPELAAYCRAHIPFFQRNVARHRGRGGDEQAFMRGWWEIWQRPAVRYTSPDPQLLRFLDQLAKAPAPPRGPRRDTLSQALAGVDLAARLGFHRVFVLVDEDDGTAEPAVWREVVERLTHLAGNRKLAAPLYLKLFLSEPEQQQEGPSVHSILSPLLRNEPTSVIMNWKPEAFRELLRKRFQSGGSKLVGFDVLAGHGVTEGVDQWLIDKARHSPRRLVQLAGALITAHANRAPGESLITLADLQAVEQTLAHSTRAHPSTAHQGEVNDHRSRGAARLQSSAIRSR